LVKCVGLLVNLQGNSQIAAADRATVTLMQSKKKLACSEASKIVEVALNNNQFENGTQCALASYSSQRISNCVVLGQQMSECLVTYVTKYICVTQHLPFGL
jgi:hypothetical protein